MCHPTETHAAVNETAEAIKTARRFLLEAEAHEMLRRYRPDDRSLTDDLVRCLTLARVAVASALSAEGR